MDYIDEFVDGVMGACKEAGLSAEEELAVVDVIAETLRSGYRKMAEGAAPAAPAGGWADKIYRHVLQIPAPVLAGGASALASVPLTAMFGKRDEAGRKNYMRNAIIAGSLGAAVPVAFPGVGPIGRFNADRQYRAALNYANARNKETENAFALAGAGLKPGAPGTPEQQKFLDYHTGLAAFRDKYQMPVSEALAQHGAPETRWRHLLRPPSEGLPPATFPDYIADRAPQLDFEQPIATP